MFSTAEQVSSVAGAARVGRTPSPRHSPRTAPSAAGSLLAINNFSAFRHEAALFVSAVGSGVVGAVTNAGARPCGRISMTLVVPCVPGHRYYGAAPAATVSAPAGWTGGTREGSGPWTYTYLADAPGPAEADSPDFAITFIALSDAGSGASSPQRITAHASAASGSGEASDDA